MTKKIEPELIKFVIKSTQFKTNAMLLNTSDLRVNPNILRKNQLWLSFFFESQLENHAKNKPHTTRAHFDWSDILNSL